MSRRSKNYRVSSNGVEFRRLVKPISKCIILVIVLSTSTGLLIRKLIGLTIIDLLTFIVGLLWLIGDIIPCYCILYTLFNLSINNFEDDGVKIRAFNTTITLSYVILLFFSILYVIEFTLVLVCFSTGAKCFGLLDNYRNTFFYLQVIVSILYTTKPWLLNRQKFDSILTKIKRFYRTLIVPENSQQDSLDSDPSNELSLSLKTYPSSTKDPSRQPTRLNEQLQDVVTDLMDSLSQPSSSTNDPISQSSKRDVSSSMPTDQHKNRSKIDRNLQARKSLPCRIDRIVANKRQTAKSINNQRRKRGRIRALNRTSARQMIIMRSSNGQRARGKVTLKSRHRCDSIGSRTINLNLNMN